MNSMEQESLAAWRDFSVRADRSLPPDAVLAADDLAGRFTYYTRRRVTALDGLVSSPAYVRSYLKQQRVDDYVRNHADYLIVEFNPGRVRPAAEPASTDGSYMANIGLPYGRTSTTSQFTFTDAQIVLRDKRGAGEHAWPVWLVRVK
jgi:hypothetical protein